MNRLLISALLGLAAVSTACSDDNSCVDDTDCFAGETCNTGQCGPPVTNINVDTNNATTANNSTSANNATTANNSTSANNVTTANNGTTGNNGTTNNGTTNNATTGNNNPDACIADPFDVSCPDDGNDSFGDTIINDTKGCLPDDNNFKVMDETVEGALLCALEQRDRYSQNYAECRNKSFRTEVLLKPKTPCNPEDIIFNVSMQGKRCETQDESTDITCDVTPEGWLRARIIVRPSGVPSIGILSIGIEPARENVHFEYDLQVTMQE